MENEEKIDYTAPVLEELVLNCREVVCGDSKIDDLNGTENENNNW